MDINSCSQIVLRMNSDQRTYVYEKVSKKCPPHLLTQLNLIFGQAQSIYEAQEKKTQSH